MYIPRELLECVSVRPVLLKGGTNSLRDKLAQPQPVLHTPLPRLLLFYIRLLFEQFLNDVDALVRVRFVLLQ